MPKNINSGLVGVCVFVIFALISLATGQEGMLWYQAKHAAKRAVLGKHTADRMYREELRRKSRESFKNNPHREEFLKKHPGFLEANPHLR